MSDPFCAATLCLALFRAHPPSVKITRDEALMTCVLVVEAAIRHNDDPFEAAAQAGIESNWNAAATDGKGSFGPMQAAPIWFCPNRTLQGCDLIDAGFTARKKWLAFAKKRFGKHVRADVLCLYWKGLRHRQRGGCSYSRDVLWLAKVGRRFVYE